MNMIKLVAIVSCIGGVFGHPIVEKNVIVNQGAGYLPSYTRTTNGFGGLLGSTTVVNGATPIGLSGGTLLTNPISTGTYLGSPYAGTIGTTTLGGGLRGSLSPYTTRTTTIVEERPAFTQFYR